MQLETDRSIRGTQVPEKTVTPRVLVALDGSQSAATALSVGRILASQLGAEVSALHIAPVTVELAQARKQLNLDTEDAKDVGIILRVGDPATEILRASRDEDGNALLTMSARALDSTKPLSSVTLSVIRNTHRPVVLVRPELVLGKESALCPVHRLLLPLDGTPATARALRSVTELAGRLGASIDLLYVAGHAQAPTEQGSISVPPYIDQLHHEWPLWSEEVINRLLHGLARCPKEVPMRIFVAVGDPGEEIVRFAAEHRDDAVVLVRRSQLESGRGKILWHIFEKSPLAVIVVVAPYR